MGRNKLRRFLNNMLVFTIGIFVFIISWVNILELIANSETIIDFLSNRVQNKKIIEDFIFVVSSIIPVILFSIIISLFRRRDKE